MGYSQRMYFERASLVGEILLIILFWQNMFLQNSFFHSEFEFLLRYLKPHLEHLHVKVGSLL